ncbi:MAG TPA: FliM/FliN family flagellar motor switch protein [Fibrobacteria bacterium]|mgnify:CR=1 FL=1|nr:FliM/FliN family flagellar motor switch protein [Fibrobacteria bacterium]
MEVQYRKSARRSLDLEQLQDIRVPVRLHLGGCKMAVDELLNLEIDQVIQLDRLAGEAVDVVVNRRHMAKGEVVVVNNHLAVRLISLLSPEERLKLV